MAYLNEFPHFEADKLNLDWILEQYSTFNKRLEEIMTTFQTAVDEMQEDVDQIRTYTQEQIAQVRDDFNSFTAQVNSRFNELSLEIQIELEQATTDIYNTIDRLSDNMSVYVEEHMEEWQTEAIIKSFISNDRNYNSSSSITAPGTFTQIKSWLTNANIKFALQYNDESTNDIMYAVQVEEFTDSIVFQFKNESSNVISLQISNANIISIINKSIKEIYTLSATFTTSSGNPSPSNYSIDIPQALRIKYPTLTEMQAAIKAQSFIVNLTGFNSDLYISKVEIVDDSGLKVKTYFKTYDGNNFTDNAQCSFNVILVDTNSI